MKLLTWKVSKSTEEIAKLEKQISAYSNDTSEESRARVQQLREDLEEAKDNLEEIQFDEYIKNQKELLSNLYDQYEDILNKRLDDVSALIDSVNNSVISQTDIIANTIQDIAKGTGYTPSNDFDKYWNGSFAGGSLKGDYDKDGKVTKKDADKALDISVGNIKADKATISLLDMNGDGKITPSDAQTIARIAKGLEGYKTIDEWYKDLGIPGYASGGIVSKTGIAMLHGSKSNPEVVLNASDAKNFIELRDIMRSTSMNQSLLDMASGVKGVIGSVQRSITGGIGDINITIPIERVQDYNDFINEFKRDNRFAQLVRSMSTDLLTNTSSLRKYNI